MSEEGTEVLEEVEIPSRTTVDSPTLDRVENAKTKILWQVREGTVEDYFEIYQIPPDERNNLRRIFASYAANGQKMLVSEDPETGEPVGYILYQRLENHPKIVKIDSFGTNADRRSKGAGQILVEQLKADPATRSIVAYSSPQAINNYQKYGFKDVNYSGTAGNVYNMEWKGPEAEREDEKAAGEVLKLAGTGVNDLRNLLIERGADAESLKVVNVEDVVRPGEIQLIPDDFMGEGAAACYTPDGRIQIRESSKDNPGIITHEVLHKISHSANPEGRIWLNRALGSEDTAKMEEGLTEMVSIITTKLASDQGYYDTLKGLNDEDFEFQLTNDVYFDAFKEKAYVPHAQQMSGRFIKEVSHHLSISRCKAFVEVLTDYLKGDFQAIVEKAGGVQAVKEMLKDLPLVPPSADISSIGIGKVI